MNILVMNAGSSSLKFAMYSLNGSAERPDEILMARGSVEPLGGEEARIRLTAPASGSPPLHTGAKTPAEAAREVLRMAMDGRLTGGSHVSVEAVGCRVVHGGPHFTDPTRVTPEALQEIRDLRRLAPLHNGPDADVIEAAMQVMPQSPVVAVFDTAFHRTLPETASTYALPHDLCRQHDLRRYGFHGISYRYVSGRLLACLGRSAERSRMIICHLGNGASVCALRDGRSVDTSMGLTPVEGLIMGTRSGDLDPGLVLYLIRELKMTAQEADDLINHQGGMLGISGRSGDVRELEQAAGASPPAALALEAFVYRVSKYIGAYAVALEGVDAVAFTGGIGEHSASIRGRVCRKLAFMGLQLDDARNAGATGDEEARISADSASVQSWVIPTNEELQIARETYALL